MYLNPSHLVFGPGLDEMPKLVKMDPFLLFWLKWPKMAKFLDFLAKSALLRPSFEDKKSKIDPFSEARLDAYSYSRN